MKFYMLFCFLFLSSLYLTLAQGSYENCCLRHVSGVKKSTKRMVVEYRKQETDGGCNLPAIVFKLRKGTKFCADPKHSWVISLMDYVDKRNGFTKPARN